MEIVILICLLFIIILLVQDKIVIHKRTQRKPIQQEKVNPNLSDIMGQPRPLKSRVMPDTAIQSPIKKPEINPDNLDIEYDDNEIMRIQIPQDEQVEDLSKVPDLEEEEEEWNGYGISGKENGLAQGITFEELSAVGTLLQEESLQLSQKETAVGLVHKIQGTELFSLLESSMEGAAQKIADLLDSSLSAESRSGSSIMPKNDWADFDIGEFA